MQYLIGEKAEAAKTITETDVYLFAGISGDFNPVHINKVEAEGSLFGKQIAHGILISSLISNVIGMKLPGPGTIYMEQNLKFTKPVYIGDTVKAIVEIIEILNEHKNILRLETKVINQNNEIVIDGYTVVKAPNKGDYGAVIEDDVTIGAAANILPQVTVGKNAIVGAGDVVTKSVPANKVVI